MLLSAATRPPSGCASQARSPNWSQVTHLFTKFEIGRHEATSHIRSVILRRNSLRIQPDWSNPSISFSTLAIIFVHPL